MIKLNGVLVNFERFPNGETRINHKDLHVCPQNEVLFKYEGDHSFIELMFIKNYLDDFVNYTSANNVLIITYMPYSRMDRSENGSVFTLKYAAGLINALGFDKVVVLEPHSDVTPALLNKSEAKYINFDLLPRVCQEIHFDPKHDYLFFPDAGAQKRYSKLKGFKQLVGFKHRDFKTGEIKSLEVVGEGLQNPDATALIVDDMSSYGGTFVHSAIALRKKGFKRIYLLVAHAENSIFKGELFDHIDKVFTTDSLITEQNYFANVKYKPQLKIYDLGSVL